MSGKSPRYIISKTSKKETEHKPDGFGKQYICAFIAYLSFILLSAIIFSLLEGTSLIDGFYFTVVTQSTVGYGDITPQTSAGLVFNFFFVIISFAVILTLFNLLFDYWFDSKINELCAEIQDEIKQYKILASPLGINQIKTEKDKKAHQKKVYFYMYLAIYILWVIIWVIFFAANPAEHHFNFFKAVYFAIITSTTVGYGSFAPRSDGGKLFAFFFINIGVIALGVVLSSVSDQIVNFIKKHEPKSISKTAVDREESQKEKLKALLSDYQIMTKHHFIVHKLLKTNKISHEDYEKFENEFKELDLDGNDLLDINDLNLLDHVAVNNENDDVPLLPNDQ